MASFLDAERCLALAREVLPRLVRRQDDLASAVRLREKRKARALVVKRRLMQKEAEEKEAARIRKRDTPIMTTSFGLSICRGASKELLQFIEVFAPMAEKTEEAEEAREEGFVLADP